MEECNTFTPGEYQDSSAIWYFQHEDPDEINPVFSPVDATTEFTFNMPDENTMPTDYWPSGNSQGMYSMTPLQGQYQHQVHSNSLSSQSDPEIEEADYNLAVAILQAEATGTSTPMIKEELRYTIQKKRRDSGLEDLQIDYREDQGEQLTDLDIVRRRRRRESNRIAAQKCRKKKKAEVETLMQNYYALQTNNSQLRQQIESLKLEKQQLMDNLNDHMRSCALIFAPD